MEWRKWDMSSTLDQGTIVYTSHNQDNLFVARYRREDGSYMLGHLSLGRVLGGNIQVKGERESPFPIYLDK